MKKLIFSCLILTFSSLAINAHTYKDNKDVKEPQKEALEYNPLGALVR